MDETPLPPINGMPKEDQDFESSSHQSAPDNKPRHKKFLIIVGSVLFALLLGIVAYFVFAGPSNNAANTSRLAPQPTPIPRGSMWFTTSDTPGEPTITLINARGGVPLNLTVMMDANNRVINAADAVLLYDPEQLEIVSFEPSDEAREVFSSVFLRQLNDPGRDVISAFKSQYTDKPTGIISLGTLTVQASVSGAYSLDFEHNPGDTVGSIIIQAEQDENILDAVYGATITVQ